jgi:hypothetical protein
VWQASYAEPKRCGILLVGMQAKKSEGGRLGAHALVIRRLRLKYRVQKDGRIER